jgi:dTDP-6-deoxy-L-talose 4-dehydrogenase (NAD+)
MKMLVTGGTGFIGQHLVPQLLAAGHAVTVLGRSRDRLQAMPWCNKVEFVQHEIAVNAAPPALSALGNPDVLVHLAWAGLPNYTDMFHIERNLPADYLFIKALVESGLRRVLVTGTCYEYGLQSGSLAENAATHPETPYGLAKDMLRKTLEMLARQCQFSLTWVRLFYMHGAGQNPKSLMAQLDRAIAAGSTEFDMSGGEQLRDFLPVEQVARILLTLTESQFIPPGTYNCCSGQPISIRRLVEERLRDRNATMQLNLGRYPYPAYEAMAFWGSREKLDAALAMGSCNNPPKH